MASWGAEERTLQKSAALTEVRPVLARSVGPCAAEAARGHHHLQGWRLHQRARRLAGATGAGWLPHGVPCAASLACDTEFVRARQLKCPDCRLRFPTERQLQLHRDRNFCGGPAGPGGGWKRAWPLPTPRTRCAQRPPAYAPCCRTHPPDTPEAASHACSLVRTHPRSVLTVPLCVPIFVSINIASCRGTGLLHATPTRGAARRGEGGP